METETHTDIYIYCMDELHKVWVGVKVRAALTAGSACVCRASMVDPKIVKRVLGETPVELVESNFFEVLRAGCVCVPLDETTKTTGQHGKDP